MVFLRIENLSSQPFNIAVLDFEPTWEISQIPIEGDESSFYPLQPKQEVYIKLRFQLPETQAYKQAKETLKLFATKGLANFKWLVLPSLDQELQTRGNLNKELQEKVTQTTNPLNKLLAAVGADFDQPPDLTRKAVPEPDPNLEWVTKEIQITGIHQ